MHVLRKEDDDWVKKHMEYEVGAQEQEKDQRGPGERLSKRTVKHKLNKQDAMDRSKWRKLIKDVRRSEWV